MPLGSGFDLISRTREGTCRRSMAIRNAVASSMTVRLAPRQLRRSIVRVADGRALNATAAVGIPVAVAVAVAVAGRFGVVFGQHRSYHGSARQLQPPQGPPHQSRAGLSRSGNEDSGRRSAR